MAEAEAAGLLPRQKRWMREVFLDGAGSPNFKIVVKSHFQMRPWLFGSPAHALVIVRLMRMALLNRTRACTFPAIYGAADRACSTNRKYAVTRNQFRGPIPKTS